MRLKKKIRNTNNDGTILCVLITASFLYFSDRYVQKYLKIHEHSEVRLRKSIFGKLNLSVSNKRPRLLKETYILKLLCLL